MSFFRISSLILLPASIASIGLASCGDKNEGGSAGATGSSSAFIDSASYAIGASIGQNLKRGLGVGTDSLTINIDEVRAGIEDVLKGGDVRFPDSVIGNLVMAYQTEAERLHTAAQGRRSEQGTKFLADNKTKSGVKTTPSGLQYKVEKEGSGAPPDSNDVVKVNYRGTFIDGTEFDASPAGQPVEFPVNQVIAGWTEALLLMKPGAKWTIYVPSNLGYGESGMMGKIGPNEVLVFDVELVSVEKKDASAADSAGGAQMQLDPEMLKQLQQQQAAQGGGGQPQGGR